MVESIKRDINNEYFIKREVNNMTKWRGQKSTATIARRLASQTWGEVQTQKKVAEGIWTYHTAGHGGYVVDTDIYPTLADHNETVYVRSDSNSYYPHEQHFAAFEEDCEFAKVEWLYPQILEKVIKQYTLKEGVTKEVWLKQRLTSLRASLERWNPDFLKKYPNPGMGKVKGGGSEDEGTPKKEESKDVPRWAMNTSYAFMKLGYGTTTYFNYPKEKNQLDFEEITDMHLLGNQKGYKVWGIGVDKLDKSFIRKVANKLFKRNPIDYSLLVFRDKANRVALCHYDVKETGGCEVIIRPVDDALLEAINLNGKEYGDDLDIKFIHREAFGSKLGESE